MKKHTIFLLAAASFLALSACDQKEEPETESEQETMAEHEQPASSEPSTDFLQQERERLMNDTMTPLTMKLDMLRMLGESSMSPARSAAYEKGVRELMESGQMEKVLKQGDKAPDFTLKDQKGNQVRLYDQLKKGTVALVWYRGGWCPYCNVTLAEYARHYDEFKEIGVQVFAISPEIPDSASNTVSKTKLPFPVLHDSGNEVAAKYNIRFKVTPEVKEWYDRGFGMAKYNADDSGTLPMAGTFVIGKDGKIIDSYFLPDYRHRIEPRDILNSL